MDRETLLLYMDIKIHSSACLKHLVETFYKIGLSILYERCEVKITVARSVCQLIKEDGVVQPPNMRSGVFTSGEYGQFRPQED